MNASKRVRVLITLGAVVVVGGAYLWFFGVQTFFALEARNIARKMPVVKEPPVELPDLSISHAPGKKLTYFGYEFEVPWDDIDEAKARSYGETELSSLFVRGLLSLYRAAHHTNS